MMQVAMVVPKEIGWKLNHRIDIIVIYQILSYFTLRATTIENAGKSIIAAVPLVESHESIA